MATWPDEATRTSNSACVWTAEAMVEGRTYTARSRHGPANQLARQLVAAGFPDRSMVIRYRGLAGTMTYRSLHAAATWTFKANEGCAASGIESHLRGSFSAAGLGKNAFHRRWPMTWGGRRQMGVKRPSQWRVSTASNGAS